MKYFLYRLHWMQQPIASTCRTWPGLDIYKQNIFDVSWKKNGGDWDRGDWRQGWNRNFKKGIEKEKKMGIESKRIAKNWSGIGIEWKELTPALIEGSPWNEPLLFFFLPVLTSSTSLFSSSSSEGKQHVAMRDVLCQRLSETMPSASARSISSWMTPVSCCRSRLSAAIARSHLPGWDRLNSYWVNPIVTRNILSNQCYLNKCKCWFTQKI